MRRSYPARSISEQVHFVLLSGTGDHPGSVGVTSRDVEKTPQWDGGGDPHSRGRRRDAARRGARRRPHESRQAVVARARDHQGRSDPVLRRRRARAPPAHRAAGDGDETLSVRRGRRILLHETRPVAAPRLDCDLHNPARLRQRHRLSDDRRPAVATSEYRVAKRSKAGVLVDDNRNAWGRTLASVYSVRPTPFAGVSAPVTWKEIEKARIAKGADLGRYRILPLRVRRSATTAGC